ncbi:MAG TPA: NADPH-dependent FMN reductase [Bacteroidia bacterium]|nr:NADPH-dependent FMN reductase [Bacteroidia bacterium]HRG51773.1 NADPH-dependent FMN reductase [Bacteroidia bacterium]
MITVISSTNRPNSNTQKIASVYMQLIEKQGVATKLFSLERLSPDMHFIDLYGKHSEKFQQLLQEYIIPAEKFVFVVPEYNGSYPGILKLFIDAVHPDVNRGKKAALVGVSSGRAGNLRGMDHLTGVLHYLGIYVHPNKLPVSSVLALLNEKGAIKDENTIKVLEKQIGEFIKW